MFDLYGLFVEIFKSRLNQNFIGFFSNADPNFLYSY